MESEEEIVNYIRSTPLQLGPVSLEIADKLPQQTDKHPELIFKARWGEKQILFVAEVKRYGSDKSVMQAANNAQYYATFMNISPLVVVPWLSQARAT